MRLIDADDLIAKLCNWYTPEPSIEESFEEEFFKGYIEGYIEVVKEIKDLIKQMPTIITVDWRWIPCEERSPDKNDSYLVTLDNGKRAFRWYSSHGWECIAGNDVIAWLPNPEPYKVFAQIVDLYSGSQKND